MSCRLAVAQIEAIPGDIRGNVARVVSALEDAAAGGADLALFPEAVITGYDDGVFAGPLPTLTDAGWSSPVREAVYRTGVTAVVNTALQRDALRFLTDVLFLPGHEPIPAYDKQHLYDSERSVFTPGEHGFSFAVGDLQVALSVCYDANFPEHAAAAADAGAHLYLNSGAYFPGGEHRRDLHYAARALDNGIYVAFSGLVGAPHDFIGGSGVFDPLGRRIAAVGAGGHLAFADLELDAVTSAREGQRMWTHRRADLGPQLRLDDLAVPGRPRRRR
ncbi:MULTISPECIES: carbon-nitrogen hydrolase family protein [Microbacterium]|uniref:carbon-nitrogen hydrolase family protein n=1 Tax=Microbacterium TaxID=33882 RepID=UPI0027829512|nr:MULTISPECIES: carbon-nitrogen hydrolase family protein [Microbacterium]MDQ1084358.1 putative amidohydrolase [Microbacterium sp. SORGH_AS_0344]MDQ1170367.1 putative amidohydrolase [Microbacterium proteolyticum]